MVRISMIFLLILAVQACQSQSEVENKEGRTEKILSKVPDSLAKILTLDYVMGKYEPAEQEDFIEIARVHADRAGMYLRKDTYAAFIDMYEAAKKEGIYLQIRSATRNFDYQKRIWENKWTGKTKVENGENLAQTTPDAKERALKILRFSSMPSTSRHHWGTDIDFNAFNNEYFATGEGKKIYDWLAANAVDYGFCQPYTAKGAARPNGYNEEKWHWSYLPIAEHLTTFAKEHLRDSLIQGFQGAQTAEQIGVVEKYVLGINELCLSPQ
ncbi:MAG: M15 family metallopeptidase [Bacteroidota bacterium]